MRHAPLILALAFALLSGACSSRGHVGSNDDAGAQDSGGPSDGNRQDAVTQADAAPQSDAPPANHDSGQSLVQCGSGYCDIANGEECCISGTGGTCGAAGTCTAYGTLNCDGPEDCYQPDKPVCCARMGGNGAGSACSAAADCSGGAMVMCHEDSNCGAGQKCCGGLPLGFSIQYCLPEAECSSAADPGVPCGSGTLCNLGDACCVSIGGGGRDGGGGGGSSCEAPTSCTTGIALACDGPEDCPQDGGTAQVCCANVTYNGSSVGGGSICVATCTQTGIIGGVLCHVNADCPQGKTCKTVGAMGFSLRLCQ